MTLRLGLVLQSAAVFGLALSGCSSKADDESIAGASGSGSGATGASASGGSSTVLTTGGTRPTGGSSATAGGAATGGTSTIATASGTPCPGVPITQATASDGSICQGTDVELEPAPIDIYMMMDRTQSMTYEVLNADGSDTGLNRWQVLNQGVSQFLNNSNVQQATSPIRVGIGFFSYSGSITNPLECEPSTYATPATTEGVEIDWISASANASPQPILNAMANKALGGQTATYPALQGALDHAAAWQASQNAINGRKTVVAFVTDGYPTECNPTGYGANDVAPAIDAAAAAYNNGDPNGIRTFVIGVAVDSYNVNNLAQAGGTTSATIVDYAGAADTFANAMLNITLATITCEVKLPAPPAGQLVKEDTVQVFYQPIVGTKTEVPYAASAGNCGGPNGGFYFDNALAPTTVYFCPCTCANLGAGTIQVRYGCKAAPVVG
jgi:hypothetical protein